MKPRFYKNVNGPTLGVTSAPVLEVDGLYFKDLARTGTLLPYEDWRLSPEERAEDLASRLSIEQIAGLMLYSMHQFVPSPPMESGSPFAGSYNGTSLEESGLPASALSDQQKKFLDKDHVRHVLAVEFASAEIAAQWVNEMQAFAESQPFGLPVSISSDPRHGAGASAGQEYKSTGFTSLWPEGMGMGATFDPELCREYGRIVAKEYRALGITTALGPQIDLATEPRWMRLEDTFGVSPALVKDMGKAYCDGLQTTEDSPDGWGKDSVAAMIKHWPGGGPCESGRDAHYLFGKYAVHPGGRLADHLHPFLEGGFKLDGPTKKAAAVMPYYTVNWDLDEDHVGTNYNRHLVKDMLRDQYGYDGVVCTDWRVTMDPGPIMDSIGGPSYGVAHLTEAERHLRILENGVDQFGGNCEIAPVLEAYRLGCEKHGEAYMRSRFESSARHLLTLTFRCGLFENPYLDPKISAEIVGCEEYKKTGFEAQLKSLVLLKNEKVLPVRERKKVYIPNRHIDSRKGFFRTWIPAMDLPGARREIVEKYFDWAQTPEEADFALVFMESPISEGFTQEQGYRPITLQYGPYTADCAREHSIAQDPSEEIVDRTYKGFSNLAYNHSDLENVLAVRKAMPDKPVIAVIRMHNPCVLSELEGSADAILVEFGVQLEAILTMISGGAEPSGLLPVQLPANMETVEKHCEDVPFDLRPYMDSVGNTYDFGFGLNWTGIIQDRRTEKYKKQI